MVSLAGAIVSLLAVALAGPPGAPREPAASTRQVLHLRGGPVEVVTHGFSLHGLPLRGAYESHIRAAAGGPSRVLTARLDQLAPRHLPTDARLGADDAIAIARTELGVTPRAAPTLVYRLVLGRPVLAWELTLPLVLDPAPSLRTVWVSATTGRLLHERDAAFHSRARVFPIDPSSTPEPVDVELTTLDVTEPGQSLDSPGLQVRGCGSEPEGEPPAWWTEGACFPRALALSNADGDWFVPLPNIGLVADNRAFDDPYAEVAAYHHVERFLEVMRERGLASPRCERFTVLVNRHGLGDEQQPTPIGGASYVDTCNADLSPTLVVGQGKDVDYAYDADVLYHEMGHSVVQQLAPDGLSERRLAPWGIVSEAGAINEGLADYFAMSVGGDPLVGEYVGRFEVASGTPWLRTGESTATCPNDLVGDWHGDGRVVSGALWAVRARLGVVVDELVLRTLPRLPPDAVLDDFGAAAFEVSQEMHAEGVLDDFGAALVERSLAARGLLGCEHVIDDPSLATNGKRMELAAADTLVPYAPGPFQLRVRVPHDAEEVTLFVTLTAAGDGEAAASFLVKRGEEPIEFTYEATEVPNTEGTGTVEAIEVVGDHDVELEGEALNDTDFIARLRVEPGEVLHVALASRATTKASASNFFVAPSVPTASEEDELDDGCACDAGTGAGAGAGFGSMGALALLALRRRRRRGLR